MAAIIRPYPKYPEFKRQMPSAIPLRCSSCGGFLVQAENQGTLACPYCGAAYALDTSSSGAASDGTHKSVAQWIARVVEPHEQARFAQQLALVLDKPCPTALIEAVTGDDPELPAASASWAGDLLGRMQSRGAVPTLIEAHRKSSAKRAVLWALGSIGGETAISYLTEVLASPDQVTVNVASALLVEIYKKGCSPSTLAAGLTATHPNVRLAVAEQLHVLMSGHLMAGGSSLTDLVESIGKPTIVASLVASLNDPSYEVRTKCVEMLGIVGDKAALPALVEAWKTAATPPADTSEEFMLRGYGKPRIEAAIKRIAGSEADQIIREAGRATNEPKRKWWLRQ